MKYSIVLFISALAVAGCGTSPEKTDTAEANAADETAVQLNAAQLENAAVEMGLPERRSMHTILHVNGTVDVPPQSLVSVSFPLGGYLQSTKLLPGMHVRKGETLAVLEDPQYIQIQQDFLIARVKLQYAEAEFKRQQELQTGQAGSAKALEAAQAEYKSEKVLVRALSEKLLLIGINPATLNEDNLSRSIRVPSPIDGFVSEVMVNIGKYVNPTDVLFELVNPSDLHLNLKVFEKDVPALQVGQKINAYTNDRPDEPHPGEIILISRNVKEDRAVEVHCHFDKYDPKLLPGMFMNALVETAVQNALAVPESALVRWENRHFVYVENAEGIFDMVEVAPGVTDGGYVQIIAAGDRDLSKSRLVVKNAYALLMKMKNKAEEE